MTYLDFLIGGLAFAGHFAAVIACWDFADTLDKRGRKGAALALGIGGSFVVVASLVGMIFVHPWTTYTHPQPAAPPACVGRSTP